MASVAAQPAQPRGKQGLLHFYDLTCPFCYIALPLDAALAAAGVHQTHLPFRAHPDVPPDGLFLGPRHGAMYDHLNAQAERAGLRLNWPPRLPPSRRALGAAEWVRVNRPPAATAFRDALFAAHFADRLDIGDRAVVLARAADAGVDPDRLDAAMTDGGADRLLMEAEDLGRRLRVAGTPAWSAHGRTIAGIQRIDTLVALNAAEMETDR